MSIALIENEIRRFLSTKEPEVICISGHWGVGKTFAWNRYLREALAADGIALKRYSYVSLFGVNSLDELKYSIFENSVRCSDIGVELSLEALKSDTTAAAERLVRKSLRAIQQTPFASNYVAGLGPMWFSSIRETIVCVDDMERKGKNLSVREVLGLLSNLKENKGCKAVLILNDDGLGENGQDREDFQTYFEKVVDASLKFSPSPRECVSIALAADTDSSKLLGENCVALGISNIRLIKRIERSVSQVVTMLKKFDEQVLRLAVQSLALLGWSVYDPGRAPSLDYLQNRRGADIFGANKQVVPANEAAWNALLDAYGFSRMDEFDLALLEGIRNGFFDPALVEKHATELDNQIKSDKSKRSFREAWGLYRDSFADNQERVLDAIYQSLLNDVEHVTPMDLDSTVTLLKELSRQAQATEIIKKYVESQGNDHRLFDLVNYPFGDQIRDPDVVRAFKDKFATFKVERDPAPTLISMADTNSWNDEDIVMLSTLPIDEYRDIFKKSERQELHKIIGACLQFDNIFNATEPMKEISRRAKSALKLIGEQSAINARRVKRYGVEIGDPPSS